MIREGLNLSLLVGVTLFHHVFPKFCSKTQIVANPNVAKLNWSFIRFVAPTRFPLKRVANSILSALVLSSLLAACVTGEGKRVLVGELEWIKLVPEAREPKVIGMENGLEQISLTNACGDAVAKYKSRSSRTIRASMQIGEFCRTPFDVSAEQVVVLLPSGDIDEYYPIEKDKNGNEYIVVYWHSMFWSLLKELPETVYHSNSNDETLERFQTAIEEGVFRLVGNEIHLAKVVFVDDISKRFKPY